MSSIKSFKPLFDRILVQRIKPTEIKTAGGIYLPGKASNTKTNEGIVLEVGTGRRTPTGFAEPLLKKGDRVLLNETTGEKINVNGVDCEILSENEVLGFIEN
eukprot:gene5023-6252_t